MKKDERKILTREDMKKSRLKTAIRFLIVIGGLGLVFAFLFSLLIPPLLRELQKGISIGDPIFTFPFIIMGIALLVPIAAGLFPIFYGTCKLIELLRGHSVEESEIEYIKPYEEEHIYRSRYENKVYYYHGIYFKEHGKFLTGGDLEFYHAGDEYYLEIIGGKKPKIVAIYEKSKYIIK